MHYEGKQSNVTISQTDLGKNLADAKKRGKGHVSLIMIGFKVASDWLGEESSLADCLELSPGLWFITSIK